MKRHKYDHNCACEHCTEFEENLRFNVQRDRDNEKKKDIARRNARRQKRKVEEDQQ